MFVHRLWRLVLLQLRQRRDSPRSHKDSIPSTPVKAPPAQQLAPHHSSPQWAPQAQASTKAVHHQPHSSSSRHTRNTRGASAKAKAVPSREITGRPAAWATATTCPTPPPHHPTAPVDRRSYRPCLSRPRRRKRIRCSRIRLPIRRLLSSSTSTGNSSNALWRLWILVTFLR